MERHKQTQYQVLLADLSRKYLLCIVRSCSSVKCIWKGGEPNVILVAISS